MPLHQTIVVSVFFLFVVNLTFSQKEIPKGTVTKHEWKSDFYQNHREYYIYVPAQYDAKKPAALMIFQDGHAYVKEDGYYKTPTILDSLINVKEIPVIIALFLNPGHYDTNFPDQPYKNRNRSFEYDVMDNRYATFLIEEFIPHIEKDYNLTQDRKMRAIAGQSSGGICAFTAAWERPDYFHKVMSHVGSFVDLRGGHRYPGLVRKSTKRDIKVFLQSGTNDQNNHEGNWWLSNLQMQSSLKFRDYDYKFVGGDGGHNGEHGGAIFAESLSWLWTEN